MQATIQQLVEVVSSMQGEIHRFSSQTPTPAVAPAPVHHASPAVTSDGDSRLKIPTPKAYDGSQASGAVENFLFGCEQYFVAKQTPADKQVFFAAASLEGIAKTWWRFLCQKAGARVDALYDWNVFHDQLLDRFRVVNAMRHARDQLADLKQEGSVRSYAQKMQDLALQIPSLQDDELLDRFLRGLKTRTRMEVTMREPQTFEEAVKLADRYDSLFSPEEHERLLREVFARLRTHKLYAKESKCELWRTEVTFIGHVINKDGVSMEASKVDAVNAWPQPQDPGDIRSFLGLAGFYRRFVHRFSQIAAPLTDLLVKDAPFIWTDRHSHAFHSLKYALTHAPILRPYDPSLPCTVDFDASDFAVGGVLLQGTDGELLPVAFESKRLNRAERNYSARDREQLALVHATHKWRHYLLGRPVTVSTDHRPLLFPLRLEFMKSRHHRWEEQLAQFNLNLVYREGRLNIVPDALSRRPDHKAEPPVNQPVLAAVSSVIPDPAFLTAVRQAITSDPFAQTAISAMLSADTAYATFALDDTLLFESDRLYIPPVPALRTRVLKEHHDCQASGHFGMDKTEDLVNRSFYWPDLQRDVRRYIRSCPQCQANKPTNRRPAGLLQPLPIPNQRWEQITMDLILGLPKTTRGHSGIVVFVDRLSKQILLAPVGDDTTAPVIARIYFDTVFRHKGLSRHIHSDRDPRFTSHFWRTLFRLLGSKVTHTTAFHPESDGQTERANRVVEEVLRHYVHARHTDRDVHLTPVEFSYNNSKQASTGFSPYFLTTGQHPLTPGSLLKPPTSDIPAVDTFLQTIATALDQSKTLLALAQNRQKQYADIRRRPLILQAGDQVYLSTSNLSLPGRTEVRKLFPKFIGPFPVQQVISETAYKLHLPDHMRIHPVFHVSNLKPFHPNDDASFPDRNPPPPPPVMTDTGPAHPIDQILDFRNLRRGNRTKLQYLVTFKNLPLHDARRRWVDSATV
ncbi:hypothetical protein KFL_011450010, partial [Klebsormidium nitens]